VKANKKLAEAGKPPLQGMTNYSLRRTFASLLYAGGTTPAYAMQQMGHSSASLALEIYAKVLNVSQDTPKNMDALLRGPDWAEAGSSEIESPQPLTAMAAEAAA
jgi:integrase